MAAVLQNLASKIFDIDKLGDFLILETDFKHLCHVCPRFLKTIC